MTDQINQNNVLALDVGDVRIGLAIATDGLSIARPFKTIDNSAIVMQELLIIINDNQIEQLVVGLPRNMNGEETEQTAKVYEFTNKLRESIKLPVEFQDESLTSVHAEKILQLSQKTYANSDIDAISACLILKDYLMTRSNLKDNQL